tara:strand:- start:769 stop:1776 length:1008 start_codon:yes stop_codon:yes gene_type:complete
VALHGAIGSIVRVCTPETVAEARGAIESSVNAVMGGGPATGGTLTAAGHGWIERMIAPDSVTTLLDWPCRAVTDAMGRIDRQYIWIIALPSVGKSAFVIQWLAVLGAQGHMVSMASLEMPIDEVAARMMSNVGHLNTMPIAERTATPAQIEKARATADKLSDNVRVVDGAMSIDQLYAWGRSEKRRGSKMLIIDNTRHIRINNIDGRGDRTSHISERLKQLRDDIKIPVVVLHHSTLNENTGKEKASWSADIERDADLMVFLRHDDENSSLPKDKPPHGRWCVNVDLDKRRNHGHKFVRTPLEFVQHEQRFERWLDKEVLKGEDFDGANTVFDNE